MKYGYDLYNQLIHKKLMKFFFILTMLKYKFLLAILFYAMSIRFGYNHVSGRIHSKEVNMLHK